MGLSEASVSVGQSEGVTISPRQIGSEIVADPAAEAVSSGSKS